MRDRLVFGSLLLLGCGHAPPASSSDGGTDARPDVASPDVSVPITTARGLTLLTEEPLPPTRSGTAHLSRLLVRDGRLYGANGSAGLMSWQIDAARHLTPRSSTEPLGEGPSSTGPSTIPRCVVATIDATGRWLYCSAADSGVAVFDLHDPDAPAVVDRGFISPDEGIGYPDLRMVDGALLAAAFDRGLVRAMPGADGHLGPWQPTGVDGEVVGVAGGGGDALVALDRRRGLLHLASQDASLRVRGTLSLDGPPLGVTVHATRAAVALGSSGVILVDLTADTPRVLRRVNPPCVATRADFTDTALAVACSTGAWLYDLRGPEPRVADFDSSQYGVLDVVFADAGRTLLVADWRSVLVYQVDPAGHAYLPEVAGSAYLRPGQGATIAARNPGDTPLTLTFSRLVEDPPHGTRPEALHEVVAMPGEVVRFQVSGERLAPWLDALQRSVEFQVTSRESLPWQRPAQGVAHFIVEDGGLPGTRPPAEGEPFPHWAARSGAPGPASLPLAGVEDIVLLLPDCTLQWGAIEDLAWQQRHGRLLPARQIVMLSLSFERDPEEAVRALTLRRLDAAELGGYALGDYLGGLVMGQSSGEFVDQHLSTRTLSGGGDFTDVFDLDAAGVVQHIERTYRGIWPLR